jgi:hypothetical protein
MALALGLVFLVVMPLFAVDSADWKEFAPKGGRFGVKFPAKTTPGKAGSGNNEFKTERCVFNATGYTLYWRVREKPFATADETEAYLKSQQKGVANAGKLISEKEITVGGIKGREFTVTVNESTTLRCRAFVIDKVVCTLVVQGKTPEAVKASDAETFLKSFKHTPKEGK